MKAVHHALKPTGSFYLAIGDEFAADLCVIAKRNVGFHLRNWIIWHYTFGQQTRKMFAKSHTHILYFTKEKEGFTFNADAVRVASARQTTYGDARANPKGKLPDDVWYLRPPEAPEPFHRAAALFLPQREHEGTEPVHLRVGCNLMHGFLRASRAANSWRTRRFVRARRRSRSSPWSSPCSNTGPSSLSRSCPRPG